ncbi:MAG: 8-oxo-dGTP diphosphatase [Candidatus Woesearchaeota archaeon]
MNLQQYKNTQPQISKRSLCILIRDKKVLLAQKLKGFGQGYYTGVGGKLEPGETVEQAAIRETQEEIGITPTTYKKVAIINFYFPDKPEWNQETHCFIVTGWQGQTRKSAEMAPQWFAFDIIPYDRMWEDAVCWLPEILRGEQIIADILYKGTQRVVEFSISRATP